MPVVLPGPVRRIAALVAVLGLTLAGLVGITLAPAYAAATIAVSKSADAEVLAGGTVHFTLTATNPGTELEFNTSFRDELPPGLTYVPGSTTPSDVGDPQVTTVGDHQVLTWSDTADMRPSTSATVSFDAQVDPDLYPVGSTFSNSGSAYASTDPEQVPAFSGGNPTAGTYTESATSNTTSTEVSALQLTKSVSGAPEGELMRGVHQHPAVYTLRLTNTTEAPTQAVTLQDFVPAGMEFLGCGAVDNSTGPPEYPTSGRLTQVPGVGANCPTPVTVSTVSNPAGLSGIYTRVQWSVGSLAVGETFTVRYAAGIPQRANTLTFPSGTPSGTSGLQAANLDNNTGALTTETTSEIALTNTARAIGDYTGEVDPGGSPAVLANDTSTVTAEDVAIQKSVSPTQFNAGGIATYTLTVRVSEYRNATGITITDEMPSGLCPLEPGENYSNDSYGECGTGGAAPTGADFDDVQANGDGSFTITFSDIDVAHDGVATITYQARMRTDYPAGAPISAGDGFTNEVSLTADTATRPGVGDGDDQTVEDESQATITSAKPTLTKLIQPRGTGTYTCSDNPADYIDPTAADKARVSFDEGDRVCFLLRADFPGTVSSKNVTVSDVVPTGMTYENNSAHELDASVSDATATRSSQAPPTWQVGDPSGGDRFVQPGQTFVAVLSAIVTTPAPGPAPKALINRVKLGAEDTDGDVGQRRDDVTFYVTAPPPVKIAKSATHADGSALDSNHTVENGEVVPYTLTVSNNGTTANGNADPIVGPDVWDPLPTGITCAAVTTISNGGVCTNPGDAAQPTFSGRTTRSAIRWNLPDTVTIAPGATLTLTYRMQIPTDASVSTVFTNNASVASYGTATNTGSTVQHRPATNVDTTTPAADIDAPSANTSYTVRTQKLLLTKSNVTAIDAPSNNATPDAVVGEQITYTITGTVPAHSNVRAGVISDPLLAQVAFVSATTSYSLDGGAFVAGTANGSFSFNAANGTLTFPTTYTNSTATAQRFRVTIVARMDTDAGAHGTSYTNTATFATSTAGGSVSATSVVRVVDPAPTLTKTNDDADSVVIAEQPIEFTLTATNAAGRPALHDGFVVDCVPDGMTVTDPGTATSTASTGSDGCAAGQTTLRWTGLDLDPGESVTLTYTAEVDPTAISLASYTNTATLTGSSLDDGANDATIERVLTATASDTVQIAPATVTKSVDEPTATIGERRTFTATFTVPANVNFYDAIVTDLLPAGLDPSTLRVESISCEFDGGGACPVSPAPLPRAAGPDGGTYIGFNFGDITSTPQVRIFTAVYSVVVADTGSNTAGTSLTNSARAQWNLVDSAPDADDAGDTLQVSSNTATATITVLEPSLAIDKTVSDPRPTPGSTFTYTVDVTSPAGANRSDAFDVRVVDTIPTGVVVNPGSISDGGVLAGGTAAGGGTITWQLAGPIGTSTPEQLTYTAHLSSPPPTGPATNTADITQYYSLDNDVPANAGNRLYDGPSDTATVEPAVPHVTVSKEVVGGQLAYIGESKGWHVQVVSDGDVTAQNVDVVDVLPPSWTYDSGSAVVTVDGTPLPGAAPVVSNGGRTLTWTDLTDLPVGAVLDITFTATPTPAVVTTPGVGHSVAQTNTASVTAEDAEGSTGPSGSPYNSGPASATARIDSADVVIEKSHSGDAVAGEPFSWTVEVRNDGPDPAVGPFRVTDTFPPGLLAPTGSGPGWSCSTGTTTITCQRTNAADTLAAGDSFPNITISGAAPTGVVNGTQVVNTASVTDRTYDPDLSNNTDADPTLVTAEADLEVVKTLTSDLVAGQVATYELQMANNGPSVHRGLITVVDPVPAGTTYVSNVAPGWTFTNLSGVLTWTRDDDRPIGPLPTITVTVRVDAGRTAAVTNTARIAGTLPDPVPQNNADSTTDTPDTEADLILQKAHEGTFTAGTDGTYHFTVLNAGPSTAQPVVTITDTLPTELTYQSFTSVLGTWTCSNAGQAVTCRLNGPLAAGAQAKVDIVVRVAADAGTAPIVNSAHVESPTTDPIPANNDDDDSTDLDVVTDLEITKSHTGTATAGEDFVYTIDVTNNGPSSTSGPITVFDALPPGMTLVSAEAPWTCVNDGSRPRLLRCTYGAGIPVGETRSFDLTVAIAPDGGPGTFVNRAVVNGPPDGSDSDLTNNVDTDETEIVDDVEIQVEKTLTGPDPVDAGDRTTFSVTVHNDGPSVADDVTVTDDLPTGMTIVSASGPGWTCTGGVIPKCVLPTLAPGATSAPITLVVTIGSGVADGTVLTNVANVDTSTAGDTPAGNQDDAQVTVQTEADLAIDKTHPGGDLVVAGQTTRFELAVTNLGPSDALAPITIVDDLPIGMSYVSSDGGWTCTVDRLVVRQEVTCTLDEPLPAGQAAPVLGITVQVSASMVPGTVTNNAEVSSPTDDPDPTNNSDSVDVDVERAADLSIVKTHTGEAHVGDPVTFTLAVHNDGPSATRNVVVEDSLPPGVSYVSATGDDWTCDADGALVTCSLAGGLASGADAPPISLTVDVLPSAYPAFTNRADVTGGAPDPDLSNNTDTDTLDVPALVNLDLDKRHIGPFKVGNRTLYRLTVTNDGPTPDPGPMTVTDRLPKGLEYVAAKGRGWSCDADGRLVRCTHDGLPVGGTAGFEIVVRVLPEAYPSVTNVGVVRTPSEETELRDNVAEDQVDVVPLVHLAVEKEVVSATPKKVVWDITTTNLGPNVTVADVVLVDDLPRGLSYVDARGPGWTCSEVSDTVTCTKPPTMEVDESSTVRLVTSVDENHPDAITNVATVSGGGSTDVVDDDADVKIPRVPDIGPGGGGGNPDGPGTGPGTGGSLPGTGGPPWSLPLLGLLMLAAGAGLVVAGRKRRRVS